MGVEQGIGVAAGVIEAAYGEGARVRIVLDGRSVAELDGNGGAVGIVESPVRTGEAAMVGGGEDRFVLEHGYIGIERAGDPDLGNCGP